MGLTLIGRPWRECQARWRRRWRQQHPRGAHAGAQPRHLQGRGGHKRRPRLRRYGHHALAERRLAAAARRLLPQQPHRPCPLTSTRDQSFKNRKTSLTISLSIPAEWFVLLRTPLERPVFQGSAIILPRLLVQLPHVGMPLLEAVSLRRRVSSAMTHRRAWCQHEHSRQEKQAAIKHRSL